MDVSIVDARRDSSATLRTQGQDCRRGVELIIARVHDAHEAELRRFLLGLDAQSRLSRFATVATDSYLEGHLNTALSGAAFIAAAFIDSRMRGFVEIYNVAPLQFAEAAIVVEREWRGRGIGSALLREAMHWAVNADVSQLRMMFARDNWPMRKMASNAGARFDLVLNEIIAAVDMEAWAVQLKRTCREVRVVPAVRNCN
jgi:GNAT superfamily N-acetyltransferase